MDFDNNFVTKTFSKTSPASGTCGLYVKRGNMVKIKAKYSKRDKPYLVSHRSE